MTHPRIEPERSSASPPPAQAARAAAGHLTPFAIRKEPPASAAPQPVRRLAQMLARLALMPQDEAAAHSAIGGKEP